MAQRWKIEPWHLSEQGLDFDDLPQTESLFALSNGHIGLRGNLEEGEPHGMPGTYLNGYYESRPLPYAEAGYGYPEAGQTVVDVTNGKLIRLLVDDEPFDMRYGNVEYHMRSLDLRGGYLVRRCQWVSPGGKRVKLLSRRLVSLVQRAVAAIEYIVEADDQGMQVVVQSELVANESVPVTSKDPRVAAALEKPLRAVAHEATGSRALLLHETKASGLKMAAAMYHHLEGPAGMDYNAEAQPDLARITMITHLAPGERLRLVKFITYGWSSTRSVPALRDQVAAAGEMARHVGFEGLLAEQRRYLDEYWQQADVQVEGDPEVQQAVRFSLFHVLQAGARAEGRAIGAKGLTGPGYDGHAFWDCETFVLPMLTYTQPSAAADALRWRRSILPAANDRAEQLGLKGSSFPWRTIAGEECSAYWPAGTAAFHINADIADAVRRYVNATGDSEFEQEVGLPILIGTARLWASLGYFHESDGEFRIDGVTGPDEYSAVADNNVYTNLMAQRNFEVAVSMVRRYRELPEAAEVTDEELELWERAASHMRIPYDEELGVHSQADDFTKHRVWPFDQCTPEDYPLMLSHPYFDLYRSQVVKQPDLVMAMFLCGDHFTQEEKSRNFDYYEGITVRDSSLAAAVQSIMAAETGHLDLAYDYWGEAAGMDIKDLAKNTKDGLHMAALAGAWTAAVFGFGGMRDHGDALSFRPVLPPGLERLSFTICWRGGRLSVSIEKSRATYRWNDHQEPAVFSHYGKEVSLSSNQTVTLPVPELPAKPRPSQPLHRAPEPRRAGEPLPSQAAVGLTAE